MAPHNRVLAVVGAWIALFLAGHATILIYPPESPPARQLQGQQFGKRVGLATQEASMK